jgi:carbonic anhydrase/acetyltransferase-like protein (isoleucine patch superfamily)
VIVEHQGIRPRIAASAYVAPNAVVCGDVEIAEDARILFGAVVTAEAGGSVRVGACTIVMEHALVRGREGHPATIGEHVIVGPHAHVNGAEIGACAFVATSAAIFPGARVGAGAEIRINGVVHVNTVLAPGGLVPIGWVAVGDPAQVFPPSDHARIWEIQKELDFPRTVFGLPRGPAEHLLPTATARYAEAFGRHRDDVIVDG